VNPDYEARWYWVSWRTNPRPQPAEKSHGKWWLFGMNTPVPESELTILAPEPIVMPRSA
jgi:hypothetical protein